MKTFISIFLIFVSLSFALVVNVNEKSGEITVEVEGMGMTFDEAKNDALRMAVEQAVGVAILGETYVENQLPVSDEVYTQAKGFIKTYEIVDKYVKEGYYYVKVRAVVVKALVEKTLKDMLKSVGNPKVLILVDEYMKSYGKYNYFYSYLKKNLVDLGAYVISEEFSRKILERIEAFKKGGKLSSDVARKLALLENANYIIYGKVEYFSKFVSDYDVWSVRVLADIEAIRTDNARIVADEIVDDAMAGATKEAAISRLAKSSLMKVAERIAKKIVEDFQPQTSFELRFNVKKLSWGSKIKRWLEEQEGIKKVIVKKRQRGLYVIEIVTSMSIDDVIEMVEECDIFDIYTEDVGNDWIEFTVEGEK